jgi:hypothetical protein
VVGWRRNRQDKLLSRKIPSKIANWLIGKVTGVPIRDNGCSLKAYRASVIKSVPLYSEMHRFIPAMTSLAGSRLKEVVVKHHARRFGVSKYGLSRTFRVLSDLLAIKTIITFGGKPLRWFSLLASPFVILSVAFLALSVMQMLDPSTDASVILPAIGVLSGAFAFFLLLCGAIGELVFRTGDFRIADLASTTTKVD